MRKALIHDALIAARQAGKLDAREYEGAIWTLNAYDWKIDAKVSLPTELHRKLSEICPEVFSE